MISQSFQTSCGTIRYWVNRNATAGITLVFLPGLTADHRLFERQYRYFEDRYNVLVWDAPGHGESRPFELTFSLMDKAEWLHGIFAAEHVEDPLLIGQSMGGYVAQCYMEKYPGTVRGLIAIDSAPLQRSYVTAAEIWLLKRCEPVYRAYPWNVLRKSGSLGCSTTPYGQRLMLEMMDCYRADEYCRLAGHGFRILAEAMEANRPYRIDCPAILLCGRQDRAGSTRRYNRCWAKRAHLPLVWIDGAGHNSNSDRPEEVNRIIEKWIVDNGMDSLPHPKPCREPSPAASPRP